MPRLNIGDRLSAAAVGLFFGGIVGLALAWLVGVYSHALGPSYTVVNFKHWVAYCGLGFGMVGLIFGPFVGTLLGSIISGIFAFERAEDSNPDVPSWLLFLVLGGVVVCVWWFAG